jgi:ubiquinone biosynthesis protein UbiJ
MDSNTRLIIEILLLVAGGAIALLAKRTLGEIAEVSKAVQNLVAEVAGQRVRLEEGNKRFREINDEIAKLKAKVENLDRDGCARREVCP